MAEGGRGVAMTAKQGREILREHKLGMLLVGLGIIGYATSFYVDDLRGKVDWAYAASVAGGVWEMIQRSRRKKANDKTADVVTDKVRDCAIEPLRNDVHELSMTVNRLHEGVQQMRVDADTKHSESLTAIAKLTSDSDENKRLHAEHISVTDSLTSGVERLNEAVGQVVPGFVGVDILKRQKP